MQLTSEITFTDVKVPEYKFDIEYFKDKYTDFYDEDFHSKIVYCKTRYTDYFAVYKNDTIIGPSIFYYGEYTQSELDILDNFIQPGYVIYDIGANIGYHTLHFATKKDSKVYAFEPNNKNFDLLQYNTRFHDNVTCLNVGVSDSDRTAYVSDFEFDKHDNLGEMKISDSGQECKLVKLDDMKLPPPNVIKIDVEGHEDSVFRGCKKIIEENHPIIFYEAMHTDLASIYDQLNQLGYNLYWIGIPNYNPKNFNKNPQNIFGNGGVVNILASPFYLPKIKNLPPVIDRDDTYGKMVERVTQKQDA